MTVATKAIVGLVQLVVVIAIAICASAGTVRFVAGWVFLAVFAGASAAITAWLARTDPALLARRTQAGPLAEARRRQRVIQAIASVAFLAVLVVPGLDHRFGWSRVPWAIIVVGDALVACGFAIVAAVFRANTFTSATIEVAAEQRVVDTGPYARVRHPMYAGALVLIAGIPLALGSWVGLALLVPFIAVLAARLVDEERVLVADLPGYAAYRARTRYRLIPGIW